METPICDFVRDYVSRDALRLHMPGHKGTSLLGMEHLDITEIDGADSLYEASGIISESEQNAGRLFGCQTFYSTEGSSQCIRAMLYLATIHAKLCGQLPRIAAARNVHKAFLSAAALLDLDVMWLYPENRDSILSCQIQPDTLDHLLDITPQKPAAVYLTSPDYLGNLADIPAIAAVCHRHGILLLVDNAHGAYLRFLEKSLHPMDLGADLCCDSAHKTLPALTGGAYLHLAPGLGATLAPHAKRALALFGSTSPSYLTLQSLDAVNAYLEGYPERLRNFTAKCRILKQALSDRGYVLSGQEPLKLTISARPYGYLGTELAQHLLENNIVWEFADPDHLVLMLTPEIRDAQLQQLYTVLSGVPKKAPILKSPPLPCRGKAVLAIRDAMFSVPEIVSVEESAGRILADPSVSCPPAVPILVCGEQIDQSAIRCFQYYGIRSVSVVKERH